MTKRIGLALSGGAMRGIFHLGVLKAFEDLNLSVSAFAGTSSGSIIAALYVCGLSPEQILDISRNSSFIKVIKLKPWKGGILSLDYVEQLLNKHLTYSTLEELPTKGVITATNIKSGHLEVFSEGEIIPRILASCAIPLMFNPIKINGERYLDGGLMMNLPATPLKPYCDVVIGVNLVPELPVNDKDLNSFGKVISRTFDIVVLNNILPELAVCDLEITSDGLQKINRFSFDKMDAMYQMGYEATMLESEVILNLIK
jgi:NTE family protein